MLSVLARSIHIPTVLARSIRGRPDRRRLVRHRLRDTVRRASALLLLALTVAWQGCSDAPPGALDAARSDLSARRWSDALARCGDDPATTPAGVAGPACERSYCELIARSMLFVEEFNDFLLPTFRGAEIGVPSEGIERLLALSQAMDRIAVVADGVVEGGCAFDLDHLPLEIGEPGHRIVVADVRGRWTTRTALLIGSIIDSVRYIFASTIDAAPTPPPPPGSDVPGLPELLQRIRDSLARQDELLLAEPADPGVPQGGWLDRNGDRRIDGGDELLLDLFEPGTERRVYDFSSAETVAGESLPVGAITPTAELPPARCGYRRWHVDTLLESTDVGTTDGMSFSPDGRRLALPIKVDGRYEVHLTDSRGADAVCLTCDSTVGWDDGVRWRPDSDVLLFVSSRDHPGFVGGAGGGAGQELYAMRADGSQQTRLTFSDDWATNYHANWSFDGRQIVWGSTQDRTWDVLVADFVDDARGLRLENVRRIVRDTSWWETHGFTPDGGRVVTTNTRAGWQSADLYTVDVATGGKIRLTDDLAWDEHAHLSPDGRKLSWISARWRPAGMQRLTDGSLSPVQDWFWIAPAILFSFYNPPAGFSTELTLMDADGGALTRLTLEDQVVADNEWSPDGRRIVFRQTPTRPRGPSRIAMLTFDDCPDEAGSVERPDRGR